MLSPLSLWERVRVRGKIVIPAEAGIQWFADSVIGTISALFYGSGFPSSEE